MEVMDILLYTAAIVRPWGGCAIAQSRKKMHSIAWCNKVHFPEICNLIHLSGHDDPTQADESFCLRCCEYHGQINLFSCITCPIYSVL